MTENRTLIQELRSQFRSTRIDFECIDFLNLKAGQIHHFIQNIIEKIQCIDVLFNALELVVERDLQRTLDINCNLYLNITTFARNVMDRNKGGRGGVIVNVLNNLGLQTVNSEVDAQQYLINKQMLLSLIKTLSDETFFHQTGVAVISVLPVINQRALFKNMDWIKKIGLQNLVINLNSVHGQNIHREHNDLIGLDFLGDSKWLNEQEFDCDTEYQRRHGNDLVYGQRWGDSNWLNEQEFDRDIRREHQRHHSNDLIYGQRFGGNIRRSLDLLSLNILRVVEQCQNGQITVVALEGVKNIQQIDHLSRL